MSRAEIVTEREHSGYTIIPMTEHDLLEVVEIEETCRLSRWGWEAYHAELGRPEAIMLVVRDTISGLAKEESVSGFIAARFTADELHINNIGVREESRRSGIGSALLGRALAQGAQAKARVATLEVRASNTAAQALYRRHGFRVTGWRRNYYREPTEDAIMMSAELKA